MDLKSFLLKTGRQESAELFGVAYSTISHWINGIRRPSVDQAKNIMAKSTLKWADIYGRVNDDPKKSRAGERTAA